jgi:hypothetical protein
MVVEFGFLYYSLWFGSRGGCSDLIKLSLSLPLILSTFHIFLNSKDEQKLLLFMGLMFFRKSGDERIRYNNIVLCS